MANGNRKMINALLVLIKKIEGERVIGDVFRNKADPEFLIGLCYRFRSLPR